MAERRLGLAPGIAGVVALGLVSAACSGAKPATGRSASAEVAFAKRVNLSRSDFPSGWKAQGLPSPGAGSVQTLEACATSSSGRVVKVVSSPIFLSVAPSNGSTFWLASFVSAVAFTQPPSSAPRLAALFTTSGGLHCMEHVLAKVSAKVGAETGGRVTVPGFSTAAARTSVAGTPVSQVSLSFTERVAVGSLAEHVVHLASHERLAVFAKGGALVELKLSGINLPASDSRLFRTILARLVSRA